RPPPKRPGRKNDEDSNRGLLYEADELKDSLRPESLKRARGESEKQWADRVANLVKRAWESSTIALELGVQPFNKVDGSALLDDDANRSLCHKEVPPPPVETIVEWIQTASERATETGRSVCSRLIWKMLAYRYGLSEDQVRGRVDAARKLQNKIDK